MVTNGPSKLELLGFWEAQPKGDYTCADCGRRGPKTYIQPQHPYYMGGREGLALCGDCIGRRNTEARDARKRAREAGPRCEVPGCRGPQNWIVGKGVKLCGRHKTAAIQGHQAEAARHGGLALFVPMDYSRDDVLRWAQGRKGGRP